MSSYDELEVAGHDIVMVAPIHAGTSTYYCERCGALILMESARVKLFHVSFSNGTSRQDQCYPGRDRDVNQGDGEDDHLRTKLQRLLNEDSERARRADAT